MGLCLSCHCGEAQHKAAVVAVSISHHSASSPARLSRTLTDPSTTTAYPSLKRFLRGYNNEGSDQSRKLFSGSPRPSLEDSQLVIPHSSELFSLPSGGSEDESGSSRSSSPARVSIALSSTSSHPPSSSPRITSSASPGGHRPVGRFSTDKPPIPPRGSNAGRKSTSTPARKSCSSLGQVVPTPELPHCKSLMQTIARLEQFCDVKLLLENRTSSLVTRNSNSHHEFSTTTSHDSRRILLQESCRDLAQKLMCFANEHADGFLSRCDSDMKLEPTACVTSDSSAVQTGKDTMPAVASFHTEVSENVVARVDATEPAGEATVMSRLPSLRFHDADDNIQFTEFEATFELLPSETSACHRSVEADQPSRASISAENSASKLGLCQPTHRRSRTSSDLGDVHHDKGSQKKGPKNPMLFRSALTDISPNVTSADEPLGRKNHQPLKSQTSTGVLKRGGSRSLDLQNCSLAQAEFDILLKSEQRQLPQDAAEMLCREESQRIEAMDSAILQQFAVEGEGNAPSPSADSALSQSLPTKGTVSVDGEEERIPESVCTEDANAGDETPNIYDISDKSLSLAFDNLFKLLQSPSGELAQNTSQLLQLLGAKLDIVEFSADGAQVSDVAQTVTESPADRPLPSCEAESWHDAPPSLGTTEQPEVPVLHECLSEALPETLPGALSVALLTDPTEDTSNIKSCI